MSVAFPVVFPHVWLAQHASAAESNHFHEFLLQNGKMLSMYILKKVDVDAVSRRQNSKLNVSEIQTIT